MAKAQTTLPAILMGLALLFAFLGCQKQASEVLLSDSKLSLSVGETGTLTAKILPANALVGSVEWTSSDAKVATVSSVGVVTAIDKGTTIITAAVTSKGVERLATCHLRVTAPAGGGASDKPQPALAAGGAESISAKADDPCEARPSKITAEIEAPKRAEELGTGWSRGHDNKSAGGTTTAVPSPALVAQTTRGTSVTGVMLDKSSLQIAAGGWDTIRIAIVPSNATNKAAVWTCSDTSVATVENGIVTVLKLGEETIKATSVDGGFTASCKLKIIYSNSPQH